MKDANQKYWAAKCSLCGQVKIAQKSKPTTCKEPIETGRRSVRRCGNLLTEQLDVTGKVQNTLAVK